jgi:hypothetical protein
MTVASLLGTHLPTEAGGWTWADGPLTEVGGMLLEAAGTNVPALCSASMLVMAAGSCQMSWTRVNSPLPAHDLVVRQAAHGLVRNDHQQRAGRAVSASQRRCLLDG